MLTAIHVLLTYQCTSECDHCFLHCGPQREGTFTLSQIRQMLREIKRIKTVDAVYFEGGEPFLYYAVLLAALRMVRDLGLRAGIVTNGYWATSPDDAEQWLEPLLGLNIVDFSVSDDAFHSSKGDLSPGAIAYRAANKLGLPCARIRIDPPAVVAVSGSADDKGQPVTGGGVLFKGRAAEKLTAGLPVRPWRKLTTCPHEELVDSERLHVDAYGNVQVCQGISIGNMWKTALSELVRDYDASRHPDRGSAPRGRPGAAGRTLRPEDGPLVC